MPFLHVWWKRKKRFNAFLEQLPDALDLISRALSAGHAFSEALHMVSIEMPEPIATEFRKAYEEQNLGLSVKLALENLTQRMPLLDLKMCVTAILIQRETGGNLAEILEKVAYTIRERFRILGDLKTLTTSSRMSAWLLCALPIFVALAVTIMNPEYMSVLWKDPRGHYLIAAALVHADHGDVDCKKDIEHQDLIQGPKKHKPSTMIIIIAISTFVCISLGMLGVYWLLYKPQSAATKDCAGLRAKTAGFRPRPRRRSCPDESSRDGTRAAPRSTAEQIAAAISN